MSLRRISIIAGSVLAFSLLFLLLSAILVPSSELQSLAIRALARQGYTLSSASFGKTFPLGITAQGMEIGDSRGVLLRLDEASLRLQVLPLLAGRVNFLCRGRIGTGEITTEFSPQRNGETRLEISRVRLEDIPFFATVGAQAKGELRGEGTFRGQGAAAQGEARLEAKGVELAGVKIGGVPLPNATYETVRGAAKLSNGKAVLESVTLQGEGIFARLSGDFPITTPPGAAPLNLTLELMPKPEFMARQQAVFLLLVKYQDTPGHYRIPIRGTLARPGM
ncbi:MAG: type II secretion system protein GspN [Geobacter sp.]|nr:type II secretion system protein GspN [Geobacter sp.]